MVSPLVSPLTYEGLVDEILGVEFGRVKIDASMVDDDAQLPGKSPRRC
jgi:hypothetical protein